MFLICILDLFTISSALFVTTGCSFVAFLLFVSQHIITALMLLIYPDNQNLISLFVYTYLYAVMQILISFFYLDFSNLLLRFTISYLFDFDCRQDFEL